VKWQDGNFAYVWFSFLLQRQQMVGNWQVSLIGG